MKFLGLSEDAIKSYDDTSAEEGSNGTSSDDSEDSMM